MRRISGISPISGVPNEHRFPEEELPQPKIDAPLKTNEKNEQKKRQNNSNQYDKPIYQQGNTNLEHIYV